MFEEELPFTENPAQPLPPEMAPAASPSTIPLNSTSTSSTAAGSVTAGRIYVGGLPSEFEEGDVEEKFSVYGDITKIDLKKTPNGQAYAFIEFKSTEGAEKAIENENGANFRGAKLRVETPFRDNGGRRGSSRGARGGFHSGRESFRRTGKDSVKGPYVIAISGMPMSGSWQDIKDHFRSAGRIGHADSFRDGTGEVSFFNRSDAEEAIRLMHHKVFRSHQNEESVVNCHLVRGSGYNRGYRYDRRERSPRRYRRSRTPPMRHTSGYSRSNRSRSIDRYSRRDRDDYRRDRYDRRDRYPSRESRDIRNNSRDRSVDYPSRDRYDKGGRYDRSSSRDRGNRYDRRRISRDEGDRGSVRNSKYSRSGSRSPM